MRLDKEQLRKLVREMSEYSAHEPKLFEYLETLGVTPSHLEMFLDIAHGEGPISAMAWAEETAHPAGQSGRRFTYDEAITLINLLNSNGWF